MSSVARAKENERGNQLVPERQMCVVAVRHLRVFR